MREHACYFVLLYSIVILKTKRISLCITNDHTFFMPKITRSIKIDKEIWERIPGNNKSEFIRNVLQSYIVDNTLIEVSDLEALKRENRLLYNTVEELKKDKERLWKEIEQYRNIYLPKPKRHWWEFWKHQKTE